MLNSNNVDACNKDYSDTKQYHDIRARATRFNRVVESTAIQCSTCDQVTVAEHNLGTRGITVYEYDPYIAKPQQKVLHLHPAGPLMRKRIESRIAVETRMLHSFDEGDFHILTRGGRTN